MCLVYNKRIELEFLPVPRLLTAREGKNGEEFYMNWWKEGKADSWILRAAFVLMLLFPAFYSPHTDVYMSSYYAGFSCTYFLFAVYLVLQIIRNRKRLFPLKAAGIVFAVLLLVYNLFSLYFNYRYLHWYWEQINNTVAFMMAAVLIGFEVPVEGKDGNNVRFLMRCIVISSICSIIYYFRGYTNLLICNNQFILYQLPGDFYETRHYWLYSHKSEYALVLVTFMALFVAYRKKFRNRVIFGLSFAVLLFCLYLTHSWTGIAGVFLILLGAAADQIDWKSFRPRKWHFAAAAVFLAAGAAVGWKILSERNIWTLGDRIPIWKAVWKTILHHPEGWGMRFGTSMIETDTGLMVNNAHNVFLNQILRFSIPVGICFLLLFLGIVVYTLVKGRSFLLTGTWIALLILLNMDYSLMSTQMAPLFLIICLVSRYRQK